MSSPHQTTGASRDRFRDHRRWRPEWTPGRTCLHWYLTFEDRPEVAALATRVAGRLDQVPGMVVVPHEWLHLTLLDVGFSDELPGPAVMGAVGAVERAGLPALRLTLGPAAVFPSALTLAAGPEPAVASLRDRLEEVMTAAGLPPQHHAGARFRPHVSVAYPHQQVPVADALAVLGDPDATAEVSVDRLHLVAVRRAEGSYRWRSLAEVALTPALAPVSGTTTGRRRR